MKISTLFLIVLFATGSTLFCMETPLNDYPLFKKKFEELAQDDQMKVIDIIHNHEIICQALLGTKKPIEPYIEALIWKATKEAYCFHLGTSSYPAEALLSSVSVIGTEQIMTLPALASHLSRLRMAISNTKSYREHPSIKAQMAEFERAHNQGEAAEEWKFNNTVRQKDPNDYTNAKEARKPVAILTGNI